MRRAIRRTLSALAAVAIIAGSVLVASPAYADPDVQIVLTSPAEGQTFYSEYNYLLTQGTVTGADASRATVSFDGGTEIALSSLTLSWFRDFYGFRVHSYTVRAYDGSNNLIASATRSFEFVKPAPPVAAITSPAQDAVYAGGSDLELAITASASLGATISQSQVTVAPEGSPSSWVYYQPYMYDAPPASTVIKLGNYGEPSMGIPATPWPGGNYVATVQVTDSVGQTVSNSVRFTVLSAGPGIAIQEPANNAVVSGSAVTLRFSTRDADNDLVSVDADLYRAEADGVTCGTTSIRNYDPAPSSGFYYATVDTTVTQNGVVCLTVRATDAAGHTTTLTKYVTVNNPVPGVPTPEPLPTGWLHSVAALDWSSVAGAAGYEYTVHNAADEVVASGTTTSSGIDLSPAITTNGSYTWAVRASATGNYSAWSEFLSFQIDGTDPLVGFDPAEGAELNGAGPLLGTFGDGEAGSGVTGIELTVQKFDGDACTSAVGDPVTATLNAEYGSWSASLAGIGYGYYCVTAIATDAAGNTATAVGHYWIDTIAPGVPDPESPSGIVGAVSELDWSDALDDSDGDVDYIWELRKPTGPEAGPANPACPAAPAAPAGGAAGPPCAGGPAAPTAPAASTIVPESHATMDPALDTEGAYAFRVRAVDPFGNLSAWSDYLDFTIDSTDPWVYFDLEDDTLINATTEFAGDAGDFKGGSGLLDVELTLQNWDGDAEECTSTVGAPITASLDEHGRWSATLPAIGFGYYCVTATATDLVGNTGTTLGRFRIDTKAPTLSLTSPVAGGNAAPGSVTFRWTSPDRDVEGYVLQVSPTAEVDDWGQLTDAQTWELDVDSKLVSGLAIGRYYWQVLAYDQVGNSEGWSELRILDVKTSPAPPKSSGSGATADESDDPEPTETTDEPTPEPTATEESVEKTDDEADAGSDDAAAGGSDPSAAGTGDSGFPIVWIIVGVVIVALAGGGFFIRFLFRRA